MIIINIYIKNVFYDVMFDAKFAFSIEKQKTIK